MKQRERNVPLLLAHQGILISSTSISGSLTGSSSCPSFAQGSLSESGPFSEALFFPRAVLSLPPGTGGDFLLLSSCFLLTSLSCSFSGLPCFGPFPGLSTVNVHTSEITSPPKSSVTRTYQPYCCSSCRCFHFVSAWLLSASCVLPMVLVV